MKHLTRFLFLLVVSVVMSCKGETVDTKGIVTAKNGQFMQNDKPYYFVGTNFWYGPILGSKGEGGDRERLHRELEYLKSIGVTNLRVLVGVDGKEGWKSKITPTLQPTPGEYNDELLDGLDYFMYQLQEHDMKAVLFLTNAWQWSGGFTQYLMWAGELPQDFSPDIDWNSYRESATKFVRSEKAKEILNQHIKYIVTRTNRYTNQKYIDDPAIFSWQLCNEPRAFSNESKEYLYKWVDETSTLIRSLDPNHMISTGCEGEKGCEGDFELFERIHKLENISYVNAHMWSLNWGWIDKTNMSGTIDKAIVKCKDYLGRHIAAAKAMNKPLVFEEFGLPRDSAAIERGTPTTHRDKLYKTVFDMIVESSNNNDVFAGCNFWAWGGEAKQLPDNMFWSKGMDYCGDPAQEAQGLNSVYSDDYSTIKIIKETVNLINK
ncbi:MAG: beta-mannosidase [Rikenellaceae bacterium]